MSATTVVGLLPLAVLAAAGIVVLVLAAFSRRIMPAFVAALAGLAATIACTGVAWLRVPYAAGALLSFDGFVLFGIVLIAGAAIFVAISSWAYLAGGEDNGGEYYFLLLVATLGGCILAASSAFASFFLGLELLSVSLYALIGWRRDRGIGTEAAIKYLILAGASSAFLLFGMALVYAATGTMDLFRLAAAATGQGILAPVGLGMMLVGIGFKLAVVPFHLWTPDIYDGAPAPVAGYIATVSKGAMVVVLARAFTPAFIGPGGTAGAASTMAGGAANGLAAGFPWVFTIIAGLSMFAGNLLALREANIKRLLAYSSIAHLGYVLVGFLAGGPQALRAVAFYLVTYFVTTLGAFAVVAALSSKERDADAIDDYRGLAGRRPWIAAILTTMLLSLAGLPLTAGFVGKFVILTAGAGAQLWALAVILAVNSTISIFYYLKVVSAMFRGPEAAPAASGASRGPAPALASPAIPLLAALAVAILALAVVALGVYPSPVLAFIGSFTTAGF
jgi:NADH-quinone oxidoreductase subunit N